MNEIRKGLKPDRLPPVIKYLEKDNDVCKLKRFFLDFEIEYLDLIAKNQDIRFSFKDILGALDVLRVETEKFSIELEKTVPQDTLNKSFKPALTKDQLIKMGNIRTKIGI